MIERVRLVLCDIDGTLVPDHQPPTEHTKQIIERLHRQGVYFGIASGRSIEQQLIKQAAAWGFDFDFEILIGMNGSELYDGLHHQRHDYYKLKREWIKEIMDMMVPFDLNPFIYHHDRMLCLRMDASTERSSRRNHTAARVASDPSELYAEDNAKIMFRIPEEKMPIVEAYVAKHPSSHYKAFKTQTTMLEFTDRRVSKAVALREFCRINAIDLQEVLSFGDMTNDNEMLMASGWGVCLINGGEDTKAIADEITEKSNEEDGFADYMEKKVMSRFGW